MQLEDDVPLADLHELVETVEERQEVVRDRIVRVDGEGPIERDPGFRFVARPHQVHAELGMRACVVGIEGGGLFRKGDGFVEPVVARRQAGRRSIDFAERRIDGKRTLDLGVEAGAIAAHVFDGRRDRNAVQLGRVPGEHALDPRTGLVVVRIVEIEIREQQLGVRQMGVDLECPLRGSRGGGRIVLRKRAPEARVGRRPLVVPGERLLERLHCFGAVVLLEKQQTPGGVERRIRTECGRRPEEPVRLTRAPQRARGARRAQARRGVLA